MSNLVPFESKSLPAFIKEASVANNDLTQGVTMGGFPFLSIKGKVFTLVKDGNRTVITKPGDDDPATSIEVVLIKANQNLSKVFYKGGYEDGANAKPDCFSNDGKKPDASIEKPVHTSCADCPKNAWGSGTGKGKACQDSRRVAIAAAGQLTDPMLLRVPPASLKPLAEFADICNKRGAPYNSVAVKLKFEAGEATPKLVFQPIGFLPEAEYRTVLDVAESDVVGQILGTGGGKPIEKPAAKKPELTAAAAPAEEEEAPAPKPAKAAAPKPAQKPEPEASDDDLLGELDNLLGNSDD